MAGERTLPGLGLRAYWNAGSHNWELQHDPDTLKLSVLCQCSVLSRVTVLPGSPTDGDMYIIPAAETDEHKIAARDNGAWVLYTPVEGWWVYVKDDDEYVSWNGTAWSPVVFGIGDAPSDGDFYARKDAAWAIITPGIADAPSDGSFYARKDGVWDDFVPGLGDAPSDGSFYARKDGAWDDFVPGLGDAPSDGSFYARKDGAWDDFVPGATTFLGLSDTPANYTSAAHKSLRVNAGGSAVEFVEDQLLAINTQTGSYTLVLADGTRTYVRMNVASANNLTVPLNSSVAFPVGTSIPIRQVGAGQTTIVATGGVTISSPDTLKMRKQGSSVMLIKTATDAWDLTGDVEV